MTADRLNSSTANGHGKMSEGGDMAYRPLNRRVAFMRKLGVGEGLNATYQFQPPTTAEEMIVPTLSLKRVVLCPTADPSELCVLEMETKIDDGTVASFPVAYLRHKEDDVKMAQVSLDLYLNDVSTLKLAKGKGPIFIIGEYTEEWKDDDAEEASGDEAEEDEELLGQEGGDNDAEAAATDAKESNGVTTASLRKRKMEEKEVVEAKKARQEEGSPVKMDESAAAVTEAEK